MKMKYKILRYLDYLIHLRNRNKITFIILITIFTFLIEKWIHLWADVSFIYTIPMVISLFFFPTLENTLISFFIFTTLRFFVQMDHVSIGILLILVTHALIAIVHVLLFRLSFFLIERKNQYKSMFFDFVSSLAQTLDMKDRYTANHSMDVAIYARRLGKEIGLEPDMLENLYIGGLLHDIGKIGIPSSILNKTSSLTDSEYELIKKHPEQGLAIVQGNRSLDPSIMDIILYHHERWDGYGYPYGLMGESIPMLARIVCIADSFDAITTHRSYQKRRTIEEGLIELKRCRGTQFDPELVDHFVSMLREHKQEIAYEIQSVHRFQREQEQEKSLA